MELLWAKYRHPAIYFETQEKRRLMGAATYKTNMAEMRLIESRWWLCEHSRCNSFNFSVCLHSFKNKRQRIKSRQWNWMIPHIRV